MNPRPMACKATALATELYPQVWLSRIAGYEEREGQERTGWRFRPTACKLRKEVIQPHLPVRLPCYDFTPLTRHTFGSALLAVRQLTSGIPNSGGVTGGVYKARERIHRAMLIRDY